VNLNKELPGQYWRNIPTHADCKVEIYRSPDVLYIAEKKRPLDNQRIQKCELFGSLPQEWPEDLRPQIQKQVEASQRKVVVLDDDPTGTQTIHSLAVLTEWTLDALKAELENDLLAFYILTNSRSCTLPVAQKINAQIGHNLTEAARQTGCQFVVVSRSDSTLRGHFPGEVVALADALAQSYDGWIISPFFLEGGRYTINDIHYVDEGGVLVPAAQTEFARDHTFGYFASNLRYWVEEKTAGQIDAKDVASVSIEDLRRGGPESVTSFLMTLSAGHACVVNAAAYRDLEVFVLGLLAAEARGKKFLFRTAASFVQVRAGLSPRPLLTQTDLILKHTGGGLIVVGSYVPRTTEQVNSLLSVTDILHTKIRVETLLDDRRRDDEIERVAKKADRALKEGKDFLTFTSRQQATGKDAGTSLEIGQKVSEGLIAIVKRISVTPRYILAKGGITSSDIATQALNVKKAFVSGQILPGVPVWQLGDESRFPGLNYIIFPGNVGDTNAMIDVVHQLKPNNRK
jgi:uncharacterized protein YgbK (DUF1537 family)